jgi:hypothetical protein
MLCLRSYYILKQYVPRSFCQYVCNHFCCLRTHQFILLNENTKSEMGTQGDRQNQKRFHVEGLQGCEGWPLFSRLRACVSSV